MRKNKKRAAWLVREVLAINLAVRMEARYGPDSERAMIADLAKESKIGHETIRRMLHPEQYPDRYIPKITVLDKLAAALRCEQHELVTPPPRQE